MSLTGAPGGGYQFGTGEEGDKIKNNFLNETGENRAELMSTEISERKAKFDSLIAGKTLITVKNESGNLETYTVTEKNEGNMTVTTMSTAGGNSQFGSLWKMEDILDSYEPKE